MNTADLNRELSLAQAPLLDALRGTPQDPEWHAEGDVAVHTAMVRDELEALSEFRDLPESDRNILRLAAALHDVGKPACTRIVDGRIRSEGHSREGERLVRLHWWRTGYRLPLEARRTILALIRCHGWPLHPRHSWEALAVEASSMVDCRLLAILAEADMRGRVAGDRDDALLKVELFRTAAQDMGCYGQPYAWANAHARWRFHQIRDGNYHFHAFDDRKFTVHMLCGLPGSGKSTFTAKRGLPVVSRDALRDAADLDPADTSDQGRASQLFQEALRMQLRQEAECVIDGTNLLRSLRSNTIDLCANYGAAVHFHVFDRDRETCLARNRERAAVVPEVLVERMAEALELPTLAEAHEVHDH